MRGLKCCDSKLLTVWRTVANSYRRRGVPGKLETGEHSVEGNERLGDEAVRNATCANARVICTADTDIDQKRGSGCIGSRF